MKNNKLLTENQKKNYIQDSGNYCPHCGSENMEHSSGFESDYNQAWVSVICRNCEKEWMDIYTLTDVEVSRN
jgi:transposase-like protein